MLKPNYGMHYWFNDDLQIEWMPYAYVVRSRYKCIPVRELLPHNKYLDGSYYWSRSGDYITLKNDNSVTRPNN